MSRITAINNEQATGKAKELLDGVQKKLGMTPNLMRTLAHSPAALQAYLNFNGALGATLNAKLREQLSLVTAEENGCGYCASAHTAIGKMVGLSEAETLDARAGKGNDAKSDAAVKFAKIVLAKRGKVSDADLQAVRNAGLTEGELAEIVAHVALNVFTNYFNNVAGTDIDFPAVALPLKRSANA